jgi:hypothetical protein
MSATQIKPNPIHRLTNIASPSTCPPHDVSNARAG